MHWTLIVLTLSGSPIPTGLTYNTLDACYAAEDRMAAENVKYYNDWVTRSKTAEPPEFIRQRLLRGICVPHPPD